MTSIDPRVGRLIDSDRSVAHLGISVVEAADGRCVARLAVTADMVNAHDIAHGGYAFALADTAFAFAANSVLDGVATAGASISYVAPARLGEELTAEARVTYADERRVAVSAVVSAAGRTVALFHGEGRVLRTP